MVVRALERIEMIDAPRLRDAALRVLGLGLARAVELHRAQRRQGLRRLRVRGRAAAARIHVAVGPVRHERGEGGAATIEDAIERPRLATVAVVVVGAADGQRVLRRRERADVVQLDAPRPGQPAVIRAQRHEALIALEGSLDQVDQVDLHVIGERAAAREPARDVAIHIDLHDRAAVEGAAVALPRARKRRDVRAAAVAPRTLVARIGRAAHAGEPPHLPTVAALGGGIPTRAEQRVAIRSEREDVRDALVAARTRRNGDARRAGCGGRTARGIARALASADQCGFNDYLRPHAGVVGADARDFGRLDDEAVLPRALLDQRA